MHVHECWSGAHLAPLVQCPSSQEAPHLTMAPGLAFGSLLPPPPPPRGGGGGGGWLARYHTTEKMLVPQHLDIFKHQHRAVRSGVLISSFLGTLEVGAGFGEVQDWAAEQSPVSAMRQACSRWTTECHKECRRPAGSLKFSAVSTESQWARRRARFAAFSAPCGSHKSHQ